MPAQPRWLLIGLVAGLTGCASIPDEAARLDRTAGPVELTATPFFPQDEYQCGPAALATVLAQSGVDTSARDLVAEVYIPARQGSLREEMLAAARTADRVPYVLDPSVAALQAELLAGRPVLVLQNLGIDALPRWHYAVVVGIDPDNETVFLRSGTERRRETALRTFLRTWQRSGFWAFITLPPGELPANGEPLRFAEAVAATDRAGNAGSALTSWRAAARQWPEDSVVLFGLANAEFRQGNYPAASANYDRAIEVRPDNLLARNNLALALAHQGRRAEALQRIAEVLEAAGADDPLRPEYLRTLQEIREMPQPAAAGRNPAGGT